MLDILAPLALALGAVLEWRRLSQAERVTLLETRIAALEGGAERLAAVEAALERMRRNL